jgi:hypothetical protein
MGISTLLGKTSILQDDLLCHSWVPLELNRAANPEKRVLWTRNSYVLANYYVLLLVVEGQN